jgi:threonine-phosphate decarboxylase
VGDVVIAMMRDPERASKDNHGGNIWRLARELGNNWQEVVDFSANINPLGFPAELKKIILNHLPTITFYPDPACQALREKLAQLHQLEGNNIIVGNGSTELLHLLPRALNLEQALIMTPAFSEYENAFRCHGKNTYFFESSEADDFCWAPRDLERRLEGIDILFLANPASPTGRVEDRGQLEETIKLCHHKGAFLLIDEAFIDFLDDPENYSLISLINKWDNLLVLRSFTKIYGIPGLRLGYLVANPQIINLMQEVQEPWAVNAFAQAVGQEIISQEEFIQRSRELVKEERSFLLAELSQFEGLKYYPSQVNFILLRFTQPGWNATTLAQELAQRKLLIRDCSNFRGLNNSYFRIAVRTRPENLKLIAALKEVLNSK